MAATSTAPATANSGGSATPTASKRFGYGIAIGANVVLLYVAHHLVAWGWPRFVTSDFDDVLPIVTASLGASVVVNVVFLFRDKGRIRSAANLLTDGLGFAATVRLLEVYPFDFSSYAHNWSWAIRTFLLVALVGSAIAAVVETVRLVTGVRPDR